MVETNPYVRTYHSGEISPSRKLALNGCKCDGGQKLNHLRSHRRPAFSIFPMRMSGLDVLLTENKREILKKEEWEKAPANRKQSKRSLIREQVSCVLLLWLLLFLLFFLPDGLSQIQSSNLTESALESS